MEAKECPMCGETMRLAVKEHITTLPGTQQQIKRVVREWVCPDCDYFEEDEI